MTGLQAMKILSPLLVVSCLWISLSGSLLPPAYGVSDELSPKVVDCDLSNFEAPTEEEKKQVEEWLLDLDLVSLLADRIAFTATGTYFLSGKESEKHISNLRQYAIGWSLDNRGDRERLVFADQRLLNADVIDQGEWRMMKSDSSRLDQLRLKSQFHEANGSTVYAAGPKSQIYDGLQREGVFFPTRAATSNPTACWAGQAIDRSKPMVTIDRLQGIRMIGAQTAALFEFRPADFYVMFVCIVFRDGAPVQCESWRQFRRQQDREIRVPTPEQAQQEREYLMSTAKRVARVQSKWKTIETCAVPTWIHGVTMNDMHEVELVADIEWYVNKQVNEESFSPDNVSQLGPFAVANE